MLKKSGLRLPFEKLIESSGLATIETKPVPNGTSWCCQSITWEIDKVTSGGNTRVRLLIGSKKSPYYLDEQKAPIAGWLYTRNEGDFVYGGERVILEVDEAQASTKVKFTITGYRLVEGR